MKKETFVEAMASIQKQMRYDDEISRKFGEIFPNVLSSMLTYKDDFIIDGIIDLLEIEVDDNIKEGCQASWIRWWIFDTDFGKKYDEMKEYDDDGYLIRLYDAGELYDFLN